ncbi:ATP-binding protein [Limnohabitans sp.]|uniref:ATP-binding protein n=1 Tax=Limnohabitans sp. TaxID=1907725 RepID=UPI0038B9B438
MELQSFSKKNTAITYLVTAGLILLFSLWTFISYRSNQDKELVLKQSIANLQNIAISFKEHSQATIRNSDEALRIIKFHYETRGAKDFNLLNEYFEKNVIDVSFFNQAGIINKDGIYEFSNLQNHKKIDLSDREHYRVQKEAYPYGVYVSKPVLGRASKKWSIQLTKRLNTPNGDFNGVAVVSFDPTYFVDYHKQIDLGPQSFTSLVGTDGFVRTLRVGDVSKIDGSVPQIVLPKLVQDKESGYFVSDDLFDHVKRIYAFERLTNQPLAVVVGIQESEALAEYDRLVRSYVTLAGLLSILIVAFTSIAIVMIRRAQRLNSELLQSYTDMKGAKQSEFEMSQRLTQSEKLAALGQLAAGVAHEINNPIGYVNSNLGTLRQYFSICEKIISKYESLVASASFSPIADQDSPDLLKKKLNYAFVKEDIYATLHESQEGIVRVKNIVDDLKNFSRSDNTNLFVRSDLHKAILSTLNIVNNEVKYRADVDIQFGDIPEVECLPSQLNQVFLNLIVNAAQAQPQGQRGKIVISTGTVNDKVWIEVSDNGAGIAKENLNKIFEPFFTTKTLGSGTGLGLAVSYGIVQRHGGTLTVSSTLGVGTRFRIEIPIRHVQSSEEK